MSEATRILHSLAGALREQVGKIPVQRYSLTMEPALVAEMAGALSSRITLNGIANALLVVVHDEEAREARIGAELNRIDR